MIRLWVWWHSRHGQILMVWIDETTPAARTEYHCACGARRIVK